MAALTGVPNREDSVSGEVVSAGDNVSAACPGDACWSWFRRGEYGGGGEATGSIIVSSAFEFKLLSEYSLTVRTHRACSQLCDP